MLSMQKKCEKLKIRFDFFFVTLRRFLTLHLSICLLNAYTT